MNSYADADNPLGASGSDQAFDNVNLVVVPEASTFGFIAGLALLGITAFRSRR